MSLKRAVPPVLIEKTLQLISPLHGFSGHHATWQSAVTRCRGYEDSAISDHYLKLFSSLARKEYPHTAISDRNVRVLAGLATAIGQLSRSSYTIYDYGGAFGGHFFDLQKHLLGLRRWIVIETPSVVARLAERVECGNLEFLVEQDLVSPTIPSESVVLASGVLQCLPGGLDSLEKFEALGNFLVLDRVPLLPIRKSYVAIQRTSRALGGVGSSFPSWIFSEEQFYEQIHPNWEVSMSWSVPEDSPVIQGKRRVFSGFLLRRRL